MNKDKDIDISITLKTAGAALELKNMLMKEGYSEKILGAADFILDEIYRRAGRSMTGKMRKSIKPNAPNSI